MQSQMGFAQKKEKGFKLLVKRAARSVLKHLHTLQEILTKILHGVFHHIQSKFSFMKNKKRDHK